MTDATVAVAERVNQRYWTVDLRIVRLVAAVLLVALNAADIGITQHLLGHGAHETNPIMAPIAGTPWAVAVKFAIPAAIALIHLRAPLRRARVAALCGLCALYGGVVLWNVHLWLSVYA